MMRYADYDPSVGTTGPVSTVPPTMRKRQTVDKINDAFYDKWFWVLQREPDQSWTLRKLDDTTGMIGEPEHTSPTFADGPERPYGAAFEAAVDWALGIVDVENWHQLVSGDTTAFVDSLRELIARIRWSSRAGHALVVRIDDDRHTPGLRLVTVRERWTESGRVSTPLGTYELALFRDVDHVLDWVSEGFDVDRAGWRTVTEGGEYQHD